MTEAEIMYSDFKTIKMKTLLWWLTGKKVMQFLSENRYVANVADGNVNFYERMGSSLPRF